jgi:hypothetical protein
MLLGTVLVLGFLSACSAERDTSEMMIPLWQLGAEPILEIGVVEGESDYELHAAKSSIRLRDARIVVANTGTQELRFYDASGKFVTRAGGRGGGPGEFQFLQRVYEWAGDSIMAYDESRQVSFFDGSGQFARSVRIDSLFEDREFPMDVWLYRRFWVDGVREQTERLAVRQMLSGLRVPDTVPGFRVVRPGPGGTVWIAEPRVTGDSAGQWTVLDRGGRPIAVVQTPPRFEIHQIGAKFVLGRWRDRNDVNFIRVYAVTESDEERKVPQWVFRPRVALSDAPPVAEAQRDELRSLLRNLVVHQEMYFANHVRYADASDSLDMELPEDVTLEVTRAGTGWVAVASIRGSFFVCAMAIGSATPPGWPEGSARCG